MAREEDMQNDAAVGVGELSNHDLLARLKRCVAEGRWVTARLLEHVAEVDARGLYRDQGFSSMFEYAVHGLHMSESEAGLRITVGRLVRRFPLALEMLGRGEVHLTALRLLAPRLTADNLELLQLARFKSKQEVQELIARYFPQPDVSDSIRRLPGTRSAPPSMFFSASPTSALSESAAAGVQSNLLASASPTAEPSLSADVAVRSNLLLSASPTAGLSVSADVAVQSNLLLSASSASGPTPMVGAQARNAACSGSRAQPELTGSSAAVLTPRHDSVHPRGQARLTPASAASVPLSEGRFKVQFTAGQRLHDKLKQAQELMRHRTANGDLVVVLEHAVDLLIAARKKQLFEKAANPRRSKPVESARTSRYVPRFVRREVVERAQERCTFVAPDGHRCTARGRLELDHRVPRGRGGSNTADNLRVLCRSHNLLMAERVYGRAFIRERIEVAQQTRSGSSPIAIEEAPAAAESEHICKLKTA